MRIKQSFRPLLFFETDTNMDLHCDEYMSDSDEEMDIVEEECMEVSVIASDFGTESVLYDPYCQAVVNLFLFLHILNLVQFDENATLDD